MSDDSFSELLTLIDKGHLRLPQFQREFVWTHKQVREYLDSLYRGYPSGSILIWKKTDTDTILVTRGDDTSPPIPLQLLLDGQQRITTLYCIVKGQAPDFFTGNFNVFKNLYFHLEEEEFQHVRSNVKEDPLYIDVMEFYQEDLMHYFNMVQSLETNDATKSKYLMRLNTLNNIPDKSANIDTFTDSILDPHAPIDGVVEIFSRLNTNGKKLTDVDITLARMGVEWPEVREDLSSKIEEWKGKLSTRASYDKSPLDLKWLMRTAVVVKYGKTDFDELWKNDSEDVKSGFEITYRCIDRTLNLLADRLGLDRSHVILSPYALPVICRWMQKVGRKSNSVDEGLILAWYIRAAIRKRFGSATDDAIQKYTTLIDANELSQLDDDLDQWIQQQGFHPNIHADDFAGSGTRRSGPSQIFLSILHMMTRVDGARDLCNGNALTSYLHGPRSKLELHHIFPQQYLLDNGVKDEKVIDAHANLCYLTADSNRQISDSPPSDYLNEAEQMHSGVLRSQWIPLDSDLWKTENYLEFLRQRQVLMAQAVSDFLDRTRNGDLSSERGSHITGPPSQIESLDKRLAAVVELCEELGLSEPITNHEFADISSSYALDLAWPDGLQEGLTPPVAYLLEANEEAARWQGIEGWRFFFTYETFEEYARSL